MSTQLRRGVNSFLVLQKTAARRKGRGGKMGLLWKGLSFSHPQQNALLPAGQEPEYAPQSVAPSPPRTQQAGDRYSGGQSGAKGMQFDPPPPPPEGRAPEGEPPVKGLPPPPPKMELKKGAVGSWARRRPGPARARRGGEEELCVGWMETGSEREGGKVEQGGGCGRVAGAVARSSLSLPKKLTPPTPGTEVRPAPGPTRLCGGSW